MSLGLKELHLSIFEIQDFSAALYSSPAMKSLKSFDCKSTKHNTFYTTIVTKVGKIG